jgi:hypothetical protein
MTLTFTDAIIAWARAIEKTNFTDFEVILSEEFEWHSANSGRATSREDTMRFVRETEMRIGNYKTLYNSDGVICGTHSVFEEGMDETIVMCVAELSEDGKKLKKWTITRANLYKNQDTEKDNAKLGFFL